jgi:hypothetical protein
VKGVFVKVETEEYAGSVHLDPRHAVGSVEWS